MAKQLQVGQVVHYVLPADHRRAGEVRPAIVVRVWTQLDAPANAGMANLQVVLDGSNDAPVTNGSLMWVGSVLFSEDGRPGTWHWPAE